MNESPQAPKERDKGRPRAINQVSREGDLPLSFAQQQLWFLAQMDPQGFSLNAPFVLELKGSLDVPILERCLNELVRRHEPLRTTFADVKGRPVQRINPALTIALKVEALESLPDLERTRAAEQKAQHEFLRGFDLEKGPLIRVRLLRLATDAHRLLLVIHHIVFDAWSALVFVRELGVLYETWSTGAAPALPDLRVQYADFAQWQRACLTMSDQDKHLAYWRKQLEGAPPSLELPFDRARPKVQSLRGARLQTVLSPELSHALRELSRKESVTPFMTLLAGFHAVLFRYSGQQDIIVGSPIATRNRRELESLIGFFVNTVALRVDFSGNPTFRQLLANVRRVCLEANAHQDLPFEHIVESVAPARDPSRTPIFQVLAAQNPPWPTLELPGLSVHVRDESFGTANFDLALFLQETQSGIASSWEFNTDLFDEATIARMLAHWTHLLEDAIKRPDQMVAELALLTESEQRAVLDAGTTTAEGPCEFIHQSFEAQAKRTPAAVAVAHGELSITYRELNARANGIALRLRGLGVGPDTRVGICEKNPLDALIGLLGVLKSGGAYLPLDPSYPRERLAFMLDDARPVAVIGREIPALEGLGIPRVALEPHRDGADEEVNGPSPSITAEQLAYVIYTSGSTGAPKGVMISHGSIAARIEWNRRFFALASDDAVLQTASLNFDASILQIFTALTTGARLVLLDAKDRCDPDQLASVVATARVTVLDVVPSLLDALLNVKEFARYGQTLRHVICGGEALATQVRDRCLKLLPTSKMHNFYGPTECTVDVTISTSTSDDLCKPALIGRPLGGARVYVLGSRQEPVPLGVAGEIWISGVPVARGYLEQPSLTAERFVPDPFSSQPGSRAYRTGDLGRWRASGELEFLGRQDRQVKLRGYRIELGEIEAALASHPSVSACAVALREEGDKQLVAYLVTGRKPSSDAELQTYLKTILPEYMVPSAFVQLEILPRSPSGKLDWAALPAPERCREDDPQLRTAMEELVAGIWKPLLKTERIGPHHNFFRLGGHSLLATQVASRVRRQLGLTVPVQALFEAPTLGEFARYLEDKLAGRSVRSSAAIVPAPRGQELPLSFAQERLWFLERLEPGGFAYNVPFFMRLKGRLEIDLLERALREVVRRHEVLRTRFVEVNGKANQLITDESAVPLVVESIDETVDKLKATDEWTEREAQRPFDLENGPLLRAKLLRVRPSEHVLLLALHHIVCDDWSMGILVREIQALYTAFLKGAIPALPPLPIQFADFAAWQRGWLASGPVTELIEYWKQQLKDAPAAIELKTDRPRPALQSFRGSMVHMQLTPELSDAARELSQKEGVTPFMTLLAAFYVLLNRYSGQSDIVVGAPLAGRTHAESENLIGFFVNSVALRVQVGDSDFRTLLADVRQNCLKAHAHQDLPFQQLVDVLHLARDPSRTPLFNVMFTFQNAPSGVLDLPGLSVELMYIHPGMAKFDLTLFVYDSDRGFKLSWEYNSHLFERATIERLACHYERLLKELLRDPSARVAMAPMLSAAERYDLAVRTNETATPYPRAKSLQQLFEEQVERSPRAVAVVFGTEQMTYAELNSQANRLARHLIRLGVDAEARVGVCLERSTDFVVSILATIKSGACYVPLDAGYPHDRLEYMARDAGIRIVIGHTRHGENWAALAERAVYLDRCDSDLRNLTDANLAPIETGAQLAYLMYTSGSTGQPKGVAIEQRAISRLVLETNYVNLGPGDVVAHASNISFDAATFEIWGALLNGATIRGIDSETLMSPITLTREIQSSGISTLFLTTALFNQLVAIDPSTFQSVKQVFFGGEVTEVGAVRRVLGARPPSRLLNVYGPTETTTFACWHPIAALEEEARVVPIGLPISNTTVHILDRELNLVPVGVLGEIYIGGDGVARGYWNRADLTAERFVPDPFQPACRLYKTGDFGSRRIDGTIEFGGRVDDQVKLRGFRIELAEIEAQLVAIQEISEAVVAIRGDGADRRLVAYVAQTPGETLQLPAVRERLARALPQHMLPSAICLIERLPLTSNGKVDRKALPDPAMQDQAEFEAPRTATESAIAEIWGPLLGLERVGAQDNFFELGGHSLLAMQLISRLRKVLGVELPVRALFEAPTVSQLAKRIEAERLSLNRVMPPKLERTPRDTELPLSFAQQRLWFLAHLEPGGFSYNIPYYLSLKGSLDVAGLEWSLVEIIRRHEVLRTAFQEVNGQAAQRIASEVGVELELESVEALSEEARTQAVNERAQKEAQRPFDLERGPLMRMKLLRVAADEHVLLLVMHHIVCDGWSMGILIRELEAFYEAFVAGTPPTLRELSVHYADFARWQRKWLTGEILESQLAYWTKQLVGAPPTLELPTDRPRPSVQSFRGACLHVPIAAELAAAVREVSRKEGVTLFMTLLAAYQALLARYSGQSDIVVGSPIAGRNVGEVEDLIGVFVNTLVLRVDVSPDLTFRGLLGHVKEVCLGAYAHQDLPFERLVDAVNPVRDLSRSPLYQVAFALQHASSKPLSLSELSIEVIDIDPGMSKFDLTLYVQETSAGLVATWEYSTDLFDQATIGKMAAHYTRLLAAAVAHREERLTELSLLTTAEQRVQLVDWNASAREYPKCRVIHQLFEEQVNRTPEANAVVFGDQQVNYRELNQRANRLAHYLISLGVGPEVVVGICVDRSIEMVVGLLGILKAGGAYLPLDPGYPADRLALMLEDGQASLLLTQERHAGRISIKNQPVLCLDSNWQITAQNESLNPVATATPANLAYVIYTSGSTGRPKGVAVSHEALASSTIARAAYYGSEPERFLLLSSISFDSSIVGIFGTLTRGGTLVLVEAAAQQDLRELAGWIAREQVTHLLCVPSYYRNLLDEVETEKLASLRGVIVAGEACPIGLVELHQRILTHATLWNEYGPTEAAVWSSVYRVSSLKRPLVPIGRAAPHAELYVLDRSLQPVPIGVAGDLFIGGAGLARGYFALPDFTAEQFIPHPFSDQLGARIYRTGDVARYTLDGELAFLGRADEQVKIRGFRIELAEVEVALAKVPGVKACAAAVKEDVSGEFRLVGYVVAKQGPPTVESLNAFLRQTLAEYMVPSAFVFLEELPLAPNGKVDRKALPAPERTDRGTIRDIGMPRNELERQLVDLWKEVLALEWVGIHDNFFELGGHSLLAIKLLTRISRLFPGKVTLETFFAAPSISRIAGRINAETKVPPEAPTAVDLRSEAELPGDVMPVRRSPPRTAEPRSLLLTGATGFVGMFLLNELLSQTGATIQCLIRAPDERSARRRLRENALRYGLRQDQFEGRIVPVLGDLSRERLGLSRDDFDTLGGRVDEIYHCGAAANALYPYPLLRPANVQGTQEILRLAGRKGAALHYVSTADVLTAAARTTHIREDDPLNNIDQLAGGYAQSKWVAERLVAAARERGLPVTVYRLTTVAGHSTTGAANIDDLFYRSIRSWLTTGQIPEQAPFNITPVDFVCRAVVHIARQPNSFGKTFHLTNTRSTSVADLVHCFGELGHVLNRVSADEWIQRVPPGTDDVLTAFSIGPFAADVAIGQIPLPSFSRENTEWALAESDIACPRFDSKLLGAYLAFMTRDRGTKPRVTVVPEL